MTAVPLLLRAHQPLPRALAAAALALLGACGAMPAQSCRDDADCRGGACVNGQCRPLVGADLASPASDGSAVADLASSPDLAAAPVGDGGVDAAAVDASSSCRFNNNGIIEREEALFLIGLGALFATGAPGATVPVDVKAKNGVWDFAAPVLNERKVFDQLVDPKAAWWVKSFPTATHAQRLDDSQTLLGVYRVGQDALLLLGVVSEQGGLMRTELTYDPPLPALKFPLSLNQTWSASSTVTGVANGIGFAATEKYDFLVDARGTTRVPAGAFETLRLRLRYRQTYGLLVTTRTTWLHVAECYGAVARVRSRDNEPNDEFTQASEYRRLAAP